MKHSHKLTIVIGTESYYPTISGVSVFSRLLARAMVSRGHSVHIICPSTRFASFEEMDHGVHVHRIRSRKNPFRKGHRNSVFSYGPIQFLLQQIKPDIIHLQDPLGTSKAILRCAGKMRTPIVMTNHFAFDYVLSYLPWLAFAHPMITKWLEQYLISMYDRCDYVTFPSETIRRTFGAHKLTVPSEAISNGVSLEQFFPSFNYDEMKAAYHIPDLPLVLHVGRLDQDKGSHLVLESFYQAQQVVPCHLIICGEGNMKEALQQQVRQLGLSSAVTFIGFINHQTELPQIYQMADLFVTASTIETQGIVALEAMASGLPLVVPHAGALPELVKDGVNGYLFEPGNVGAMAKSTLQILQHPDVAEHMGERSLEMVEEHELSRTIHKFETIYREVIAKS